MKRILIVVLIISILGVATLIVTDPNIVGDFFGINSNKVSEGYLLDGWSGYDYAYYDKFSSDSATDTIENLFVRSWENIEENIDVSAYKIKDEEFKKLYMDILNENPLCYHVDASVKYSVNSSGYVISAVPSYNQTEKTVINKTLEDIRQATDAVLNCLNDDMNDFEKVMAVHDYMVLNYKYDESLDNHSISIMITKSGVCESYSRAFMHLMNTLNIDCKVIESDDMVHSWNLVCVDGQWYHMDLTMDDPVKDKYGQVSHEYAFLSTDAIENASNPHYGFEMGDLSADSKKYDNAPWRESLACVVSISGTMYYTDGYDIVSSEGDIIYEDLDGGDDMWNISERRGYPDICLAGLGVYDGLLYFNTDEAIMSYNPISGKLNTVKSKLGICGLFINNGVLYFGESNGNGLFEYSGEISVK